MKERVCRTVNLDEYMPYNGLLPSQCQVIIWSNARILLIGTVGTNFNEILIKSRIFSFKKMHLKMPSEKWWPICLGLYVLMLLLLAVKLCCLFNHYGNSSHHSYIWELIDQNSSSSVVSAHWGMYTVMLLSTDCSIAYMEHKWPYGIIEAGNDLDCLYITGSLT